MYSQVQKLAILCNICFWSTIIFQLWEKARLIPEPVLNSIVILGISALAVNLFTICLAFYFRWKKVIHVKATPWIKWVVGISTLCQLGWLGYTLRSHIM